LLLLQPGFDPEEAQARRRCIGVFSQLAGGSFNVCLALHPKPSARHKVCSVFKTGAGKPAFIRIAEVVSQIPAAKINGDTSLIIKLDPVGRIVQGVRNIP
jgi:hypothetical protein